MIITADFPTKNIYGPIHTIRWESPDLDVDLSRLKNMKLHHVSGTYKQVMSIVEVCEICYIDVTSVLSKDEVIKLNKLSINRSGKTVTKIQFIGEKVQKRLKYLSGYLHPGMKYAYIRRMLLYCPRIILCTKNQDQFVDTVSKYGQKIRDLHICCKETDKFTERLIRELPGLYKITIHLVNQDIINALSKSRIVSLNTGLCTSNADITPIITNSRLVYIKTKMNCSYDLDAKITLRKFSHPKKELYEHLVEICHINNKKYLIPREN